jgi:outer membrane usher protein FimD/PapC
VDPESHLVWALKDSQSGVSHLQAERFCRAATYGALRGWRLPTIEELESLVGAANADGRRLKAPIKVTGWEWSASSGQQDGEAWALDFGDGGRASVSWGDSGLNRGLCVRSSDLSR